MPATQTTSSAVAATPVSADTQVQQGLQLYEAGKFIEAINVWQQALSLISTSKDRAIVHSNLAVAYRQVGNLGEAIRQWERAIEIYQEQKDEMGRRNLTLALTEQGQTYSDLGQHQRGIKILQSALEIARKNNFATAEAAAAGALGNAYWASGDYDRAISYHETSLKMGREQDKGEGGSYTATALNNLGNVYVSRSERYRYQANAAIVEGDDKEAARLTQLEKADTTAAMAAFEQSARAAKKASEQAVGKAFIPVNVSNLDEVRALLNLNRLLAGMPSPALDLISRNRDRILAILEQLPDSRDKAYALINLAVGKTACKDVACNVSITAAKLLGDAIAVARNVGDDRAESFALGSLGQLYEQSKQYSEAMELTRQAQFAAQKINAADSLYRWQWQSGRIMKATGNRSNAIASYEQAIATLQSIRSDIVAANKDLQFDFRDSVEPVYRELMALLLQNSGGLKSATPGLSNQSLTKVLDILELLKLAELQNFFGDECVEVAKDISRQNAAETIGADVAVIYSVILGDRTEMILQLPKEITAPSSANNLRSYRVAITQEKLQQEIDEFRLLLEKRSTEEYLPQAQKIYDLLIRPMAADIIRSRVKTLVFIHDGVLRKVPMAALHDGKQFLIQNYAIATTPSLSLTASKSLDRRNLKALSVGLTVERPPFAPLPNVSAEVASVQKILGGSKLLDNDFTLIRLETELRRNNFPVIHLATHGKFGVDAASTFLLGFDTKISIEQLDNLLRIASGNGAVNTNKQPIELLTLSACQTAAGDNRSALGIAGIAVRAGVRSAVASLWFINDEATVPLITEFYTQLSQNKMTKVEALQKAQLKAIASEEYNHPAVWSPLILIGNWL